MFKEFKEFAVKGNMIDMAIGIIIGAAFGGVAEGACDTEDDLVLAFAVEDQFAGVEIGNEVVAVIELEVGRGAGGDDLLGVAQDTERGDGAGGCVQVVGEGGAGDEETGGVFG